MTTLDELIELERQLRKAKARKARLEAALEAARREAAELLRDCHRAEDRYVAMMN